MRSIAILMTILFSALQYGQAQVQNKKVLAIGESFELSSEVLNEDRTINIYLPNSYHADSSQTYPVIYLLDGSLDEDFIHVVGNVQFCSFSWINIIPETIVVGISNIDRKKDFTYPSTMEIDQEEFPTSGGAVDFIQFISKELQPIIETNYNTNGTKTLIGQSLGGLLATQILFEQPELFQNYIIVSPSLWWDDELILKRTLDKSFVGKSIYVAVGKEGPLMERVARTLYNKLSLEKSKEAKLYFQFLENQNHGDALHLAVYDAFEKMFADRKEE